MSQEVEIVKKYRFEAAHFLPNVPEGHKCRRMHGHSFRFELVLRGPVDPHTGWLIDFGDISKVVKPLIENHLDHYLLNDVDFIECLDTKLNKVGIIKLLLNQIKSFYKIRLI